MNQSTVLHDPFDNLTFLFWFIITICCQSLVVGYSVKVHVVNNKQPYGLIIDFFFFF